MRDQPGRAGTPAIELREVHKSFGSTRIIQGVSLAIAQGERHAIIGPNGAGKSTLYNLISGRFPVTSGTILLNGEDVTGLKPFEINRKGLSRSFQVTNIFHNKSVFENIRCGVLWSLGYKYSFLHRVGGLREVADAFADLAGGVLEVRGAAGNAAPQGDQADVVARVEQAPGDAGQLEGAGHAHHVDVFVGDAVADEGVDGWPDDPVRLMNVCFATARLQLGERFTSAARQLIDGHRRQPAAVVDGWIRDELPQLAAQLGIPLDRVGAGQDAAGRDTEGGRPS